MRYAGRRTALGVLLAVLVVVLTLTATAAPPWLRLAGAQAFPAIKAAGLFTFPGDWSKIPAAKITVFYPARASWQFLTSAAHPGHKEVVTGTVCTTCHQGQEKTLGDRRVKAGPHEPDPVAGKRGWIDVTVQAAFDDQYIYVRYE